MLALGHSLTRTHLGVSTRHRPPSDHLHSTPHHSRLTPIHEQADQTCEPRTREHERPTRTILELCVTPPAWTAWMPELPQPERRLEPVIAAETWQNAPSQPNERTHRVRARPAEPNRCTAQRCGVSRSADEFTGTGVKSAHQTRWTVCPGPMNEADGLRPCSQSRRHPQCGTAVIGITLTAVFSPPRTP